MLSREETVGRRLGDRSEIFDPSYIRRARVIGRNKNWCINEGDKKSDVDNSAYHCLRFVRTSFGPFT